MSDTTISHLACIFTALICAGAIFGMNPIPIISNTATFFA